MTVRRAHRETGAAAFLAIATRWPDLSPRDAMRELLYRHGGNASAAARELELAQPRTLLAALNALGLGAWLAATWPDRDAGGGRVARRAASRE